MLQVQMLQQAENLQLVQRGDQSLSPLRRTNAQGGLTSGCLSLAAAASGTTPCHYPATRLVRRNSSTMSSPSCAIPSRRSMPSPQHTSAAASPPA